jgi:hypothetical protein
MRKASWWADCQSAASALAILVGHASACQGERNSPSMWDGVQIESCSSVWPNRRLRLRGELPSPLGVGLSWDRQSCLSAWRFAPPKGMKLAQADYQSAAGCHPAPQCGRANTRFSIRDEFLGLRRFHSGGHEAGEIPSFMSNCARLDKLLNSGADTSVRATSEATASWCNWPISRGERGSPGQAEAYPTNSSPGFMVHIARLQRADCQSAVGCQPAPHSS